jgi:hypothetical protein
VIEWSCAVIALAAFIYRFLTLPRDHFDPALVALSIYFLASFVSFIVGLEPVCGQLAELTGFTNITIIASHAAVVILTTAQQVVLIYWAHRPDEAWPKARQRILAFGVILAALIAMFLAILPSERQGTSETSSLLNMHNPAYAAYVILFTVTAAVGQAITLRMSWRFRRIVDDGWLRWSMWLISAGAILILGYCTLRVVQVVDTQIGIDASRWNPVQWLSGDFGSLLEIVGLTVPGWGPALFATAQWIRHYRQHQEMRPLWVALHQVSPDIALDAPVSRWGDIVSVRDLHYRRYRRMIEILDGLRALRPYLDPTILDIASRQARRNGMSARRVPSILDGAQLHAAIQARATQEPLPTEPPTATTLDVGDDLAGEAKRLVALATSFRRATPLAGTIIAQAGGRQRRS